LTDYQVINW